MSKEKQAAPKFDFKKEFKYMFSPSAGEPEMVEVPELKYLMIDGKGDPNTAKEFEEKVGVLYGLAYTIKFMLKKDPQEPYDFTVPPLSGLWCAEDMTAYTEMRKDEWEWTLMILMPDRVTGDVFQRAREELREKKNPQFLNNARFEVYAEGKCAQIMHIGPYSEEGPTIEKLHKFFQEQGYTFNGRHHEIYIGDPRRSKPEKLKTIIRQPIKKIK